MIESEYVIQVVHKKSGQIVEWAPGLKAEKDLEADFLGRLAEKGVGMWRTQYHVLEDAKLAWRELLHDLKSMV